MGGWVDGHFDIFDILLKPPQPFTGLIFYFPFKQGALRNRSINIPSDVK